MQAIGKLEAILAPYEGHGRDSLLPLLWDVQTAAGYISREAVHGISHTLRVPEAEIYGVISFYALFYDEPAGRSIIRVCTDPSCALASGDSVISGLCQRLDVEPGDVTDDGAYSVEQSPCLGMCDHAPAALVSEREHGELVVPVANVDKLLELDEQTDYIGQTTAQGQILLSKQSAENSFKALRQAILDMTPETVIDTVTESGLIGRGGAAFPTGLKWRYTRGASGSPKYVVCNADESEPGTFKDRVLMELHPHRVLEGIALAAYAIGAEKAYIFVRGEYPVSEKRLREAIEEAVAGGFLGERIMGSDFSLDVEIRRGAGAYICGEETALFEAIEGRRGFPRIKPPFPTTYGLFGKPTVINNVETLAAIPEIITRGAGWFKDQGTQGSTGTKLVSVSGHVKNPGVYEINPGITLRHLLEEVCGGLEGELKAVLMGGAAGTFLTTKEIDVSLSFEALREIGGTFGSGAVMVFNSTVDLGDVLRRLAHFFQHESCGKCFPCQLGTQRQVEILDRIDSPIAGDKGRLVDVGLTMTEASLCGLGQTAASAVLSALDKFPELYA